MILKFGEAHKKEQTIEIKAKKKMRIFKFGQIVKLLLMIILENLPPKSRVTPPFLYRNAWFFY